MRPREDKARKESREFNIKDARQQPTSSHARATATDSGPKASGQEKEMSVGLPADLHDLASASLSNPVQQVEGDPTAVRTANPLADLQADEEFVIKNYRLIKKKKGGLEPIQDRMPALVKEPAFAQGTDPANLPGSPLSARDRIFSGESMASPEESTRQLEQSRLGGDGGRPREAEPAPEPWF